MGATVSHRPPPQKPVNVRRPAKPSTDDSYDAETDMVVSSLPSTIASAPTSLHPMPPSKPSTVHGPSRPFAVQLTIEGAGSPIQPLPGQYYLLAKLIPPKVDTKLNEWEDWKCNPPRAHWDLIFGVNRYALDGSPMGGGSTPGELLFLNKPATPHILSFYVATDDNKLNTDRINIAVFTIR